MATKRKAAASNASSSSKRVATKKGPIDLTSDSDDDSKSKANGNGKSNGSNGHKAAAPVAPVAAVAVAAPPAAAAAAAVIGQSVAETKKPAAAAAVAAPVVLQSLPAAVAVAAPPAASSSSSSSSSAQPSPTAVVAYKESEAYTTALKNNQKGIKRLATEYSRLGGVKEYTVSLVDNDLFLWEIKIPFDATTTLGQDLAQYSPNDRNVLIRMAFDTTHPFKAPFVRVRSPRFLKGSSNVMEGGAICMDTFSAIGWSPAMTAEKSILAIQSLLCTAGLNARLDPVGHAREYTEEEGKRSYAYVLQAHKEWDQTGSYNAVQGMPAAAVLPPARPVAVAAAAARKR